MEKVKRLSPAVAAGVEAPAPIVEAVVSFAAPKVAAAGVPTPAAVIPVVMARAIGLAIPMMVAPAVVSPFVAVTIPPMRSVVRTPVVPAPVFAAAEIAMMADVAAPRPMVAAVLHHSLGSARAFPGTWRRRSRSISHIRGGDGGKRWRGPGQHQHQQGHSKHRPLPSPGFFHVGNMGAPVPAVIGRPAQRP
ncbi:hypothetical protein GTW10_02685 [Aurantimonas endophytica]|nr:hypothetical protein [Aurantimonas endophytica]